LVKAVKRRRRFFNRRMLWVSTSLFVAMAIVVFGISYYALRSLTYASDSVYHGKKQSDLVQEVRAELVKRSDLTQVTFKNSDDMNLAGLLIKRQNAQANIVFCHGYRGSKELMYAYIDLFPQWNMLFFDFRAHGQSDGTMTTIGCLEYKDVIAAAHFLREQTTNVNTKPLPMIVLGISMGGAAALKAAETDPGLADVLIIDSSFARLDTTVIKAFSLKSSLPRYPFFTIIKGMFNCFAGCDLHAMNPAESVKSITMPIFFIHACDDTFISPKSAIKLYVNAKNKNSKIWIAPHCRHGWLHSYCGELYKKKVTQFLRKTIPTLVV